MPSLTPNEQLGLAISLAATGHLDQPDKRGKAYILHPLQVMQKFLYDPELAAIAVMHDLIEDTEVTVEDLSKMGFSDRIRDALILLTHDPEDDYLKVYIPKMYTNMDAISVKREDLTVNHDLRRLVDTSKKTMKRHKKYAKAFVMLGEARDRLRELTTGHTVH